jgi:hypothetical protein
MYAPMILKKGKKKYILEKMYPNYALYSDLEYGYKECFSFYDLGLLEEKAEPYKKIYKDGSMIL